MGGYKGFEGDDGTSVRDEVELITLTNPEKFSYKSNWCQRSFPPSEVSLDGATVDMIDTFNYMEGLEDDSKFSSAHNSVTFEASEPLKRISKSANVPFNVHNLIHSILSLSIA